MTGRRDATLQDDRAKRHLPGALLLSGGVLSLLLGVGGRAWQVTLPLSLALLGGFLFGALGIAASAGLLGRLITATVGAVVLLFLLKLIKR